MKSVFNLLIILFLSESVWGQAVKIYPYYVEPSEYSDFTRRPFITPTWKTFNDKVQFVGGRNWGSKFGVIDYKAPNWLEGGTVLRPNYAHFLMSKDSLQRTLMKMKKEGLYLFNINAYGPGTPTTGSFGQFKVEPWKVNMMEEILGDHFMGFDLGEQDGRYWADSRSIDFPMSSNYQERYLNAMKYMHRSAIDQGDIISMLSVKWFWHYPIKDGFITISGAESQNKTYTSNDQIHYSFLRGASKQYGLLWYGDVSVFNSWGWKTYGTENDKNTGPSKGNSIAWIKRMILSQYQYNSAILGFEGSKFDSNNSLSPIGILQKDMQEFVKRYPKPGPQHTPIALLQDFFSGWMTPSEPFADKYKVWNFLPYKKGDFFSYQLLKMFYNDFDQVGLNKNEYGGLCNTPYGDGVDILLSDVRLSTLSRYQMLVVADEIVFGLNEVSDKLKSYINQGGHLVITSDNARKLFPNIDLNKLDTSFSVNNFKMGKGEMTVLNCQNMGIDDDNHLDTELASTLHSLFESTRIFSVGDSLGYITNIEGKGKYILGIYNHSLESKPFNIECHVGKIRSIKELKTTRNLTKEKGYFPEGYEQIDPGLSNNNNIAAGDVRLFLVNVQDDMVDVLPEVKQEKRIQDRYLSVSSLLDLKSELQTMPTFFDYFSGVKLNWKDFLEVDENEFKENSWWYNLKQLQFAVEFDQEFIDIEKNNSDLVLEFFKRIELVKQVDLLLFTSGFDLKQKEKITNSIKARNAVFKESNDVFIADKNKSIFPKQQTKPIIVNFNFSLWDDIYPVAKAMSNGTAYTFSSIDSVISKRDTVLLKAKTENRNFYFSHHDIKKDVMQVLKTSPEYIEHFGGVKIDGSYLYSRSIDKCKKEGKLFKTTGLNIIVDITREINNYPNLTWLSEIDHAYQRSVSFHDNILEKMEILGIKHIIIGSHMRPEIWQEKFNRTPEESIISGMSLFIKKANERGIIVSVQNRMYKHYPSRLLAKPDEVSSIVANFRNKGMEVKYAVNLGFGEDPKKVLSSAGKELSICIVAAEGSNLYDYQIPFFEVKDHLYLDFKVDKNVIKVFDSDYKSTEQLINDKNSFQNQFIIK